MSPVSGPTGMFVPRLAGQEARPAGDRYSVTKSEHPGRRCHNLAAMTETAGTGGGQCECALCLARAQKPAVRAWRWIAGLDLTKPPAPVLRWAVLLILGLCCWAAGIPLDIRDWLGPIIIAGALILPDVAGFGIAGIRLDLKQAQDELAALKLRLDIRQQVTTNIYPALERATKAQTGEDSPRQARIVGPEVDDDTSRNVLS
jgi:hypothetical protein